MNIEFDSVNIGFDSVNIGFDSVNVQLTQVDLVNERTSSVLTNDTSVNS